MGDQASDLIIEFWMDTNRWLLEVDQILVWNLVDCL